MAESLTPANSITLPRNSRYRNTRLYIQDRVTYFGTWKPPTILQVRPTTVHIVTQEEHKRPDLIAYRVYRDATLFWAICIRNGIQFGLRDIQPGQKLVCPHIDDINAALALSSPTS